MKQWNLFPLYLVIIFANPHARSTSPASLPLLLPLWLWFQPPRRDQACPGSDLPPCPRSGGCHGTLAGPPGNTSRGRAINVNRLSEADSSWWAYASPSPPQIRVLRSGVLISRRLRAMAWSGPNAYVGSSSFCCPALPSFLLPEGTLPRKLLSRGPLSQIQLSGEPS